ncbi:MAG: peptide chain release factor N(5)-glutamine methyltransferase [Sphaerochaetaceae bacterium]|nr:peptide chain release factor N(5)-glutamine methyltransferase [Sphaerochaetaceae bacterium]
MTVEEALRWATSEIHASQVSDTPLLDASLLLCHIVNLTRVELYTKNKTSLTVSQEQDYRSAVTRRTAHFPIAYLTGEKEFYGRDFTVHPAVLIPRGDTETAVEMTLGLLSNGNSCPKVLDLCCGSGCIGITIALEHPSSRVTLSDISEEALSVTRENAARYDIDLEIVHSDLFTNIRDRDFTCIVTNPPYVTPAWYTECSPEVHEEPRSAIVDESTSGLSIIENIILESPSYLHKDGYLVIECDYRQVEAVQVLMSAAEFTDITVTPDMSGRDRVVSGRMMCTRI